MAQAAYMPVYALRCCLLAMPNNIYITALTDFFSELHVIIFALALCFAQRLRDLFADIYESAI